MIGRRGSVDLPRRLEALSSAVDLAGDRLDADRVAFADQIVTKAEERLRHGTTNTLVALLGATGSGKSSVANALVGSDVATAGLRRPTTSSTLGCYWPTEADGDSGGREPGDGAGGHSATALLDWLEVKNRHLVGGHGSAGAGNPEALAGLVLLDVPDHDSVAVEHRMEMERIADHADLLVWVTDAEKYADKAMHDYLRTLGEHGAVTAMVLNKIDLLAPADVERCVTDMGRLLAEDGLPEAPVIALSAATGAGVPELRALLADSVSRQRATVDRLTADVRTAAGELLDELGPAGGGDEVPKKVATRLAADLVEASGLGPVTDAVASGHRRDASARVGWPFTRWARRLRPHPLRRLHLGVGSGGKASLPEPSGMQLARSESAVRSAVGTVTKDMPDPWPELVARAATPDQRELNNRIEDAIASSVREVNTGRNPAWWSLINLLQLILAVAAIAGAVWLGLLAFGAYLRLPDVPTPTDPWLDIPIPTLLLIGGLLLGVLLAALARQFVKVGARRRASAVSRSARDDVRSISDEMVIEPMNRELARRSELRSVLVTAAEGRRS